MEIKSDYKQTAVGIIPEDWDVTNLGSIAGGIYRGASPRPIDNPIWFDDQSRIGWVRISDVTQSGRYLKATSQCLSALGIRNSRFVPSGSLIMSICATVGRPIETRIDVCIHDGFVVFEKLKISQQYLYHVLASLEPSWSTRGQTGSQMNLNTGLIKRTKIVFPPSFVEQKAIAEALSDMDGLIESLEQLIAKKRLIKQGAMQELLTGIKRLPGFNREWVVKNLGDIVVIRKGELITEKATVPGPIPVIAGGKEPAYYHKDANRHGKTITISASGANAGYIAFHNSPIFASDCSTISEGDDYFIEFVYYALLLHQNMIYNSQTGGAQPHIHPSDLRQIIIDFPPIKGEQAAIATVLSDMDTEIFVLEEKLDKIRQIKLGMMQELLTGRIRLI